MQCFPIMIQSFLSTELLLVLCVITPVSVARTGGGICRQIKQFRTLFGVFTSLAYMVFGELHVAGMVSLQQCSGTVLPAQQRFGAVQLRALLASNLTTTIMNSYTQPADLWLQLHNSWLHQYISWLKLQISWWTVRDTLTAHEAHALTWTGSWAVNEHIGISLNEFETSNHEFVEWSMKLFLVVMKLMMIVMDLAIKMIRIWE